MKLEILPRTDLAIRAIQYIAGHKGANSNEIAAALGTSPGYLTQILRTVVDAGWLTTSRGPTGGYQKGPEIGDLSLLDVIEALEGPTDDGVCVLRGSACLASKPCEMHDAWAAARNSLITHVASVPITEQNYKGAATC